jgi:hypothetical protein
MRYFPSFSTSGFHLFRLEPIAAADSVFFRSARSAYKLLISFSASISLKQNLQVIGLIHIFADTD